MSADAIVALEAVLGFLRLGQVDVAEAYCETALKAFTQDLAGAPAPPPDPSGPSLPPNGSGPAPAPGSERVRSKAADRMRKLRAKQKAAAEASRSVTESVTRDVTHANTEREQSVTRDVTRDAPVTPVFSLSRSPSFSRSLFLSESMEREEGGSGGRTRVTRDASERNALRSENVTPSVTRDVTERNALRPGKLRERPPPSETNPASLEAWCVARGLDPAHPLMGRFLDVRRNATKGVLDWPGCWRVFVADEASGRFGAKSGLRRAAPPLQTDPPGERAWKIGR